MPTRPTPPEAATSKLKGRPTRDDNDPPGKYLSDIAKLYGTKVGAGTPPETFKPKGGNDDDGV
jgi:hypothetical protein